MNPPIGCEVINPSAQSTIDMIAIVHNMLFQSFWGSWPSVGRTVQFIRRNPDCFEWHSHGPTFHRVQVTDQAGSIGLVAPIARCSLSCFPSNFS